MHDPGRGEGVQDPVDARQAKPATPGTQYVEDLTGAQRPVLPHQRLVDLTSGAGHHQAGATQRPRDQVRVPRRRRVGSRVLPRLHPHHNDTANGNDCQLR